MGGALGRYCEFERTQAGRGPVGAGNGKPITQVARQLGINDGTSGNWVSNARRDRDSGNAALSELERAGVEQLLSLDPWNALV